MNYQCTSYFNWLCMHLQELTRVNQSPNIYNASWHSSIIFGENATNIYIKNKYTEVKLKLYTSSSNMKVLLSSQTSLFSDNTNL